MHTHSYLCMCVGGIICNPKCTEWEDEEERPGMGLGEAARERNGERVITQIYHPPKESEQPPTPARGER